MLSPVEVVDGLADSWRRMGRSEEWIEAKRAELLDRFDPEKSAARDAAFAEDRRKRELARQDGLEERRRTWTMVHAYRWMLQPVPYWDEDTDSVKEMPLADSIAEVEAIRSCTREWHAGGCERKLPAHLRDWLGHFNKDWENIVRRELALEEEYVTGFRSSWLEGAYNH